MLKKTETFHCLFLILWKTTEGSCEGKAETIAVVWPGKEKAPVRSYCSLPILKGAYEKEGANLSAGL